jgi:hypothetical protein
VPGRDRKHDRILQLQIILEAPRRERRGIFGLNRKVRFYAPVSSAACRGEWARRQIPEQGESSMNAVFTPIRKTWICALSVFFISSVLPEEKPELRQFTLDLLETYCPDGYRIVSSMDNLEPKVSDTDFTNLIDGNDERACVTSINTIVHEDNHGANTFIGREVLKQRFGRFSDVFYHYDYYYLNDGRFILLKKTPVFMSRELVPEIPERMRTYRFDYIDTGDTLQSTQHFGIYGLLDEFNSYYQGTKAGFDLLGYFEEKGSEADWHDFFTLVNSTYYGCLEMRYYILKYLMFAKKRHPEVYQGILNNKDWCAAFLAVDRNVSGLMQAYFDKKPEIFERLRGFGWKVSEQNDRLTINTGRRNKSHMNFMEIYELLDMEMKKPEYQAVLSTIKGAAQGWDPESVYGEVEAAMKEADRWDTQGGSVDPHAPRLEDRIGLEAIADMKDPSGDTEHPFIDLLKASVSRDESGLVVRIRVADIPEQLTFNQAGVQENELEYQWSVLFDLQNDSRDEYSLGMVHFKEPDASTGPGELMDNVQVTLWKLEADGASKVDVNIRGAREGNELILDVPSCEFVSSIRANTRIRLMTSYTDGERNDEDLMP